MGTVILAVVIIVTGLVLKPPAKPEKEVNVSVEMSIRDIAPKLNVTGKALARELNLPLDASKTKTLSALGVETETLEHAARQLLSHRDTMLKYYVWAALVPGGLVFLVRLGRPDRSDVKHGSQWYPRMPYIALLLVSVIVAGFLLGKAQSHGRGGKGVQIHGRAIC